MRKWNGAPRMITGCGLVIRRGGLVRILLLMGFIAIAFERFGRATALFKAPEAIREPAALQLLGRHQRWLRCAAAGVEVREGLAVSALIFLSHRVTP